MTDLHSLDKKLGAFSQKENLTIRECNNIQKKRFRKCYQWFTGK